MKKLMIIWGFVTSMLFAPQIYAQVSVNINIGAQPVWGPVGYDYVEYYYMPDIEVYYSVPEQRYIYWDYDRWVWVSVLPARYSYYNIYTGYKVIINEPHPYYHAHQHRIKYKKYRGYHDHQNIIRDIKGGRPKTWKNSGYSKLKSQAPQSGNQNGQGGNSKLKKQAPAQKSTPQTGNSKLKKQAPAQKSSPQQGSPLKKQAPAQQKSSPQQGSPLKKQAPAQQPASPQKSSPMKNQAPQQSAPQRSPQKSSPIKNQAPTRQPAKGGGSPIQKAKGGHGKG